MDGFNFGGKHYDDPFAKEIKKAKKQKSGKMEDPFKMPLEKLDDVKHPKGFGNFGGYSGAKESKGIGFGGFDDLGTEKEIGRKTKKGVKKIRSEKQPFDMFGGMKL